MGNKSSIVRKPYTYGVLTFLLLLIYSTTFSQDEINKQSLELNFSIGCSVQFFAFEHFLQQPNTPRFDRNAFLAIGEANGTGSGLSPALQVYYPRWFVGLKYDAVIRYNIVDPVPVPGIYGIIIDHHFSAYHKFNFTSQLLPRKVKKPIAMYVGAGYSMISPGQSYDYNWSMTDRKTLIVKKGSVIDLSFHGVHVMLGAQIYKGFYLETKFIHVPQNQIIYKLYQSANMVIIKGAYQIPVFKKKKA